MADDIDRFRAEAILDSLSSEIKQLRADVAEYRESLILLRDMLGGEEANDG